MKVKYVGTGGTDDVRMEKWLTKDREYFVLEISGSHKEILYRLIGDDNRTPGLYRQDAFSVIDGSIPVGWAFKSMHVLDWVVAPKEFLEDGFWERYFDDCKKEIDLLNNVLRSF